jgi:hypothetical protein
MDVCKTVSLEEEITVVKGETLLVLDIDSTVPFSVLRLVEAVEENPSVAEPCEVMFLVMEPGMDVEPPVDGISVVDSTVEIVEDVLRVLP